MDPEQPSRDSQFTEQLHRRFGREADPWAEPSKDGKAPSPASELVQRLCSNEPASARYEKIEEIASGGMGTIIKTWDRDLRRTLAMKITRRTVQRPDESAPSPIDRQSLLRFFGEAQVTGQLDHPGIVPVHDLGIDGSGRAYFTMQLVNGRELREIFVLVRNGEEGWTQTRALGVLLRVCEAMAYAHSRGVIHRDLKPANIMIGRFGAVYVMDWGLAKVLGCEDPHDLRIRPNDDSSVSTEYSAALDENPDTPLITIDGAVIGTPAYMPPEQALGELERLDRRSDVYSLGAILYHLLAGRMPYVPPNKHLPSFEVLNRLVEGPPTPIRELAPDVPAELEAICEKAMARKQDERYASTIEMAEDLQAYLEGHVVSAYQSGFVAELKKWMQRNKGIVVGLVMLVVVLALGSVTSAWWFFKADAARRDRMAITELCNDIQQKAANAHLWFEEAIAQDTSIDLDQDVYGPLADARRMVVETLEGNWRLLLPGGGRSAMEELDSQLGAFAETTRRRWEVRGAEGMTGGELDQQYDAIYMSILGLCNDVTAEMEIAISRDWKTSAAISIGINVGVLLLLAFIAGGVLWKQKGELRLRGPRRVTGSDDPPSSKWGDYESS